MNLRNCINGLYDLDSKRYVEYVVKKENAESSYSLASSRVKMLGIELGKVQQNADGIPSNVGVLSIKSVNQARPVCGATQRSCSDRFGLKEK